VWRFAIRQAAATEARQQRLVVGAARQREDRSAGMAGSEQQLAAGVDWLVDDRIAPGGIG
jgi:Fe-S cluster assembly scaffold protein SufB